jgi:uncharacterized delta-60 repeat protein
MFLMWSRFVRVVVLSCCILAGAVSAAGAAPGDIDRSFGQEGIAYLASEPSAFATPDDMTIGPDKKIYVLQTVRHCPTSICTVEHVAGRLLADGRADGSFGPGGVRTVVETSEATPSREQGSLALGADGRVVVATTDNGKLVLARLNPDGSTDTGFGLGGSAEFDLGVPVGRVRVAVQGDSRIVVGAEPESGYGGGAVIVSRYTSQGGADPTFNGGAPLVTSLGSGLGGLAIAGAGRPVLAGPRCCSVVGRAIHVARLDESGGFDSAFGRAGQVFVDDVVDGVGIGAMIVAPNGEIYIAGSGRLKGGAFILGLRPNGKLDRKFGHRGIAYMRHTRLRVSGAAIDSAGNIMLAGAVSSNLTVLRRLRNGRPDRTFAGGSTAQLRSIGATRVVAAGLQAGRRLVALGSAGHCYRSCDPPETFLVRYLGGPSASRCLGKRATVVGTRHGERLVGTPHRDVIAALSGNDVVFGRGGNDLICGGRGDDRLVGGEGRDRISGGAGHNKVQQ